MKSLNKRLNKIEQRSNPKSKTFNEFKKAERTPGTDMYKALQSLYDSDREKVNPNKAIS